MQRNNTKCENYELLHVGLKNQMLDKVRLHLVQKINTSKLRYVRLSF